MKIAYSLLILFFSLPAIAQRIADIQLLPSMVGTTEANQHIIAPYEKLWIDPQGHSKYYITFRIKNLGPDSLLPYDVIMYETSLSTMKFSYGLDRAVPKDSVYDIVFKSGTPLAQIPIVLDNMPFPFQAYTDTANWCDTAWVMNAAMNTPISDPNAHNNKFCQLVDATVWTGIERMNGSEPVISWYPNPATDMLTLKLTPTTGVNNVTINLRNLLGKEVYHHQLDHDSGAILLDIDVSHLPAGIYMAEVLNGEALLVNKITIR